MRKYLLLSCFLLALATGKTNIGGTYGYINSPSAEGMQYQEFGLGMALFSNSESIPAHATYYGTLGTATGLELGFCGRTQREGVFLNLKYFRTLDSTDNPLMVGMGFENIASSGLYGDNPDAFMVATKKFDNSSSFSIGAKALYFDKSIKMGAILGTEIFMDSSFSSLFDLTATGSDRYNINAGVRYYNNNNAVLYCYILNLIRNDVDLGSLEENERYLEYPTVIVLGVSYSGFME